MHDATLWHSLSAHQGLSSINYSYCNLTPILQVLSMINQWIISKLFTTKDPQHICYGIICVVQSVCKIASQYNQLTESLWAEKICYSILCVWDGKLVPFSIEWSWRAFNFYDSFARFVVVLSIYWAKWNAQPHCTM